LRSQDCSPDELESRVNRMSREFYSVASMARRLPWPTTKANFASWIINLAQRKVARNGIHRNEFDSF
jgi:hypothetical protein